MAKSRCPEPLGADTSTTCRRDRRLRRDPRAQQLSNFSGIRDRQSERCAKRRSRRTQPAPTDPGARSRTVSAGRSARVGAHQLGLADDVLLRRFPDIGNASGWRLREPLDVQRGELEAIMMGAVSFRRSGPAVAWFAEIVDAHPKVLGFRSMADPLGQSIPFGRDVVQAPVAEYTGRGIGILNDQDEALGTSGRGRPLQRRREILAVDRIFGRNGFPLAESRASQSECHAPELIGWLRANPLRGDRGLIHPAFRKLRQKDIRLFFFLEALVQGLLVTTQVQLARKSYGGAIGRNLVMFELLGRRDKPRIAKIVTLQHAEHLFGFVNQRLHRLVRMRLRVSTVGLQDRLESFLLDLCFLPMTDQSIFPRRT